MGTHAKKLTYNHHETHCINYQAIYDYELLK